MKDILIELPNVQQDILLYTTDSFRINKNTLLTVPNGYRAVVLIDEKPTFSIDACANKCLAKEYYEHLGKQCRVAFINDNAQASMLWGFGDVQINNTALNQCYRAGANGTYTLGVTDIYTFVAFFHQYNTVNEEILRNKTLDIVKNYGGIVLSQFVTQYNLSAFDFGSNANQFQNLMLVNLQREKLFEQMGLTLSSLTVTKLFVKPEDYAKLQK